MAQQMLTQPDLLENISIKEAAYTCVEYSILVRGSPKWKLKYDKPKRLVWPENLPDSLLLPVQLCVLEILGTLQAMLFEKRVPVREDRRMHTTKAAEEMADKLGHVNKYFTLKKTSYKSELKFHPMSNLLLNRHIEEVYETLIKSEERADVLEYFIGEYDIYRRRMGDLQLYQYDVREEMRNLYYMNIDRKKKFEEMLRSI